MGKVQRVKFSKKLSSPLWIVVLRLILDLLYIAIIQPDYEYYGFKNDFSPIRYLLSWIIIIFIAIITNRWANKGQPSYKVGIVLLYFGLMPAAVLYAYMKADFIFYLFVYYFVLIIAVDRFRTIAFSSRNNKDSHCVLLLFIIILFLNEMYIWSKYSNFHIQLDLYNVYEVRSEATSFSMPTIMKYIHSWARMITPFLAIFFLHIKKRWMFVTLLFLQFIIFSIDASKSSFFAMAIGVGLYYLLKNGKSFVHYIPFSLSIISIISLLEKLCIGSSFLTSYFIRRMMFFPALLNYQYYDYFSTHGIDYYRRSIGGLFSKSIYSQDMADIIGQVYYGHPMHANNGLFADAYCNFGAVGIILMPILLAIVLKILDGSTKQTSPLVVQTLVISYGFSLISSSFFTILLTHGLGIICILGYFCKDGSDLKVRTII